MLKLDEKEIADIFLGPKTFVLKMFGTKKMLADKKFGLRTHLLNVGQLNDCFLQAAKFTRHWTKLTIFCLSSMYKFQKFRRP